MKTNQSRGMGRPARDVTAPKPQNRAGTMAAVMLACAAGGLWAGCSSSGSDGVSGRAVSVRPADFAAGATGNGSTGTATHAVALAPDSAATSTSSARSAKIDRTGPVAASDGIFDVRAEIGAPRMAASDAAPIEDPRLVQAKVGDVNGRAVYAMDFLAPMADRFKAQAKKLSRDKWLEFAEKNIRLNLDLLIETELLMAEARDSFTPQQRQGFFAFMEDMRATLYSENRGSQAAANKKLFEEKGMDEEQWMRNKEEEQLIQFQIGQMIRRKTVVSWREIRQQYEREYEIWNPPPKAFFHVIRVTSAKTDDVAAVQQALDRGDDFSKLAAGPLNEWKRATAGLYERDVTGEFSTTDFFGDVKDLNAAAQSLEPGHWAGPVPWGKTSTWVFLDKIEDKSQSLYDVQVDLERAMRDRKALRAKFKYVERIKARTSVTDVDEMTKRLLEISSELYYPPPLAAPVIGTSPINGPAPAMTSMTSTTAAAGPAVPPSTSSGAPK